MKAFRILIPLGTAALLAGLGFLPAALGPRQVTVDFTIEAGSNRYARWEFDVLSAGSVAGSFVAASAGRVGLYVMTQTQYDAFLTGHSTDSLTYAEGSSGNFSVELPSGGAFFIAFVHGPGYDTTAQNGATHLTISAISTWSFVEMLSGLGIGITLVAIGLHSKATASRTAGTGPTPTGGVVLFETPKHPPGNRPG